jgi:cytochrome c peroxidase
MGLTMPRRPRLVTLFGAALAGLLALAYMSRAPAFLPASGKSKQQHYARPTGLPHPPGMPPSPELVKLGQRLFGEVALSGNGQISCATCHDPKLAFTDGAQVSLAGATGRPLRRHTPALWNLAWAPALYWDGRAESLEVQAQFPMSHPDEMASAPEEAAARLSGDPAYVTQFRAAFPGTAAISSDLVLKALAAYERTLVSPPTRFDRWLAGDPTALDAQQQQGFAVFSGKAQCINCHTGFAFTDQAFHDIGLPGNDRGRGAVIGVAKADHAFKTPGLRELAWTAPYMHDGSLAALEDVVRHYEAGGIPRPSRSPDMPRSFTLTVDERAALIAFLETLSSEQPPEPSQEPWVRAHAPPPVVPVVAGRKISQRDKTFAPSAVRVKRGEMVTILNDDTRTHNVRVAHPAMSFNSGAQEPGASVSLRLDTAGLFLVHCGIHPTMQLRIEVE